MLESMALLSWFHRVLSRAPASGLAATLARADQGDADAQYGLGLKYGAGSEEPDDHAQGAEWFRKAADQNHSLAQFNLGMMFATGRGMPRDEVAATSWFRKAAEGDDCGGQYMLGMSCHRTSVEALQIDATESRIEAYKWFRLAAAHGYNGSQAACERVTMRMSREEVTEGNRRSALFVARKSAADGQG